MSRHNTGPSSLADPFSSSTRLTHDHAVASSSSPGDGESAMLRAVESSVVRRIFGGNDVGRRTFMKMLGGILGHGRHKQCFSSGCGQGHGA